MNKTILALVGSMILPSVMWAQGVFCPQRNGVVKIGMTQEEVIAACGDPLSKEDSNKPLMRKVPIVQMTYQSLGQKSAFYGVWALPIGQTNTGTLNTFGGNNGGARLQVTLADGKVESAMLDGSSTNAFSLCGQNVKIGDPGDDVYSACGEPSVSNESFIWKPIKGKTKPQVWTYQLNPYDPPMSLTFIDGQLKSIQTK